MAEFRDLGLRLTEFASSTQSELVLIAPFVKVDPLKRILDFVDPDADVTLVTRWRVDEIAAGVSDVGVFEVVDSIGGRVLLLNRLHAKYFRADNRVFLGSANLTKTALGWTPRENLELLIETQFDESARKFEAQVLREALVVDDVLAGQFAAIERTQIMVSASGEAAEISDELSPGVPLLMLLPRDPRDCWLGYQVDTSLLSAEQLGNIDSLLAQLTVPKGISNEALFTSALGASLWLDPLVQDLYALIDTERRFGEITDFLQAQEGLTHADASHLAQTLVRTVLYYLPERFVRRRPRHSELLARRDR